MSSNQNFGAFSWMGAPSSTPKPAAAKTSDQKLSETEKEAPKSPSKSPARHRRGTLQGMFDGLKIQPGNATQRKRSSVSTLPADLAKSMRTHWPNWGSLSRATGAFEPVQQVNFTVKMTRNYREMSDNIGDPEPLFKEIAEVIEHIRNIPKTDFEEIIKANLEDGMINIIFSSNNIERAGQSLDETIRICRAIFAGKTIAAEDITERSEEYQSQLEALIKAKRTDGNLDLQHVIRSRKEVIQHAKALNHMVQAIAVNNEPLTEDLIQETHGILVTGIDIHGSESTSGTVPSKEYGGIYRKIPVMAGSCCFVTPKFVPAKMRELVQKFNEDITAAETTKQIDPFSLAAKYANMFVLIHPFLDGNGRTCRIILNAILLKYSGIVIAFGEHDQARNEYLEIVKRAGEDMTDDQPDFAAFVLQKASQKLRTLKLKLSKKQ